MFAAKSEHTVQFCLWEMLYKFAGTAAIWICQWCHSRWMHMRRMAEPYQFELLMTVEELYHTGRELLVCTRKIGKMGRRKRKWQRQQNWQQLLCGCCIAMLTVIEMVQETPLSEEQDGAECITLHHRLSKLRNRIGIMKYCILCGVATTRGINYCATSKIWRCPQNSLPH